MLTQKRFIAPILTGDWAKDGPELLRLLSRYFLSLESPGSLNITQAYLDTNTFPSGDWTPTIIGSTTAGTQTYTTQTGRYVDLGNDLFFVAGRVILSALGGTAAGNVLIGGLPFTTKDESGALVGALGVSAYDNINLSAGYSQIGLVPSSNAATLMLVESGDNVAAQQVAIAGIGNTTGIVFGGMIRKA